MEELKRQEEESRGDDNNSPSVTLGVTRGSEIAPLHAWSLSRAQVALEIDASIYSIESLLRAAYKFTDRCYMFLSRKESPAAAWIAVLAGKSSDANLETLVGEFMNELLDQRLRESLESQFGQIRTLIVAQAFSEGNLLDQDREGTDYHTDPLNIGRRR